MYCLWLNGTKVYDLEQLKAAFDPKALELYFLGGGLVRWLSDCGENELAQKAAQIGSTTDIPRQLAEIFGMPYVSEEPEPITTDVPQSESVQNISSFNSSLDISTFGFFNSSYNLSSFELTSFGGIYTSFLTGRFSHEYEYEYESGSFSANSFNVGSFSSNSFSQSSFFSGSFDFYGSFDFGEFKGLSSQHMSNDLTPQQKVRINLSSCPLNRYGYGIHIV